MPKRHGKFFSPFFLQQRGCKDNNSAHSATSCTQTSCKHTSSHLRRVHAAALTSAGPPTHYPRPVNHSPIPLPRAPLHQTLRKKKKKRFKVQKSHSASPFSSVKVMRREIVLLGSQQLTLRRRPKGGEKKSMKSLMMKRRETRSARLSSAPAPPPERLQDCAFFYSGNTLNRLKCKAVKRHLQNTSDLNATAPNE